MSVVGMIVGIIVMLLVLIGANSYIALRLYHGVKYLFPQIGAVIFITIGILITLPFILGFTRSLLPIPATAKNIFGVISSYWMGIFVYLILYFVIADIVLLILKIINVVPKPIPQSVHFILGLVVILATTVTVSYGIYNANRIKQVSYDIKLEEKIMASELNIVLISDIHIGALKSEKRLEKIVRSINDLEPDIVCISGDIFDNDYYAIHKPEESIKLLKSVKTKYGVYACLGNHDSGKTINQLLDFLDRSNIKVLNDEYVVIDKQFILVGRLDASPIGGYGDMRRKKFEEVMTGIDYTLPIIVMDHNPANIEEYGDKVDLILSGHTHRGQIFPGSMFTNAMFIVDYGYYRKDNNSPHVVVTSGAGTWGMPMRVGTNCEIVSIKLH